jgi:ATP-dependent DNA helicase RecG
VAALPGVTPTRRDAFRRLGVETIEDLLRLAPRRYEDRRHPVAVTDLEVGATALVIGQVARSRAFRARGGLSILELVVEDASGAVPARWFHRGFVPRALPEGRWVALYGVVGGKQGRPEFKQPALERLPPPGSTDREGVPGAGRIVPVHPLTTRLTAPIVRRAVWAALPAAGAVSDPVPPDVARGLRLPALSRAIHDLHFPSQLPDAERARRRLAFDELLVHEILLARRRRQRSAETAPALPVDARLDARIRARIPFTLTPAQDRVVAEIREDLARARPMSRLLQGDVGSGKTAVAVYALLAAVAGGRQAAFMAPTEVLARQHERTLGAFLEGSRVRIETLTGGWRGKAREEALSRIAAGEADLVIGTHAVISRDVRFRRLGLVVVDEQHKFGVRQRRDLLLKGADAGGAAVPHCLVMTATPIPRTLALTVYGDLDVSVIEGRPPGRKPVETWVVAPRDGRRVFARVREELAAGRQAFVIYPLVEESDRLGLRDAIAGCERWRKALPDVTVGLLHGRMKRDEKDAAMEAFRTGGTALLVSTVVIEVGVDVPNATVLVVEHAERFGLSQLHQLRGRIGRGRDPGLCVLVDRSRRDRPARLEVLAGTDDGFRIAEEDLLLRGTGDVLGTRQHGRPGFRAASLPRDLPLLAKARRAGRRIVGRDPGLERPAHAALRALVEAALVRSDEGAEGS